MMHRPSQVGVVCFENKRRGRRMRYAAKPPCLSLWERCPQGGEGKPSQSRLTPCQLSQRESQVYWIFAGESGPSGRTVPAIITCFIG